MAFRSKAIDFLKYLIRASEFIALIPVFFLAIPAALAARKLRSRHGKTRVLIAGIEISSNLKEISNCLSEDASLEISVAEFYSIKPSVGRSRSSSEFPVRKVDAFSIPDSISKKTFRKFVAIRLITFSQAIYLFRVFFNFDVVLLNWTKSFLPGNLDYPLMRLSGILLLVRHCGDDVRYRPLQHAVHGHFGVLQWDGAPRRALNAWHKFLTQLWAELNAIVLSTRDHATFQIGRLAIRPYVQSPLPQTTGFEAPVPLILHAPSDPSLKGTWILESAIEILRHEGLPFEYLKLSQAPHDEVLRALGRTSILVDQPGAVPARLAVEGMASGCAVVGGNVPEIHGLGLLPVVPFLPNAEHLASTLRRLLLNQTEARELGRAAKAFSDKHFSGEVFRKFFLGITEGKVPTFELVEGHYKLLSGDARLHSERLIVGTIKAIRKLRGIDRI
jgi:hypothetical protein